MSGNGKLWLQLPPSAHGLGVCLFVAACGEDLTVLFVSGMCLQREDAPVTWRGPPAWGLFLPLPWGKSCPLQLFVSLGYSGYNPSDQALSLWPCGQKAEILVQLYRYSQTVLPCRGVWYTLLSQFSLNPFPSDTPKRPSCLRGESI